MQPSPCGTDLGGSSSLTPRAFLNDRRGAQLPPPLWVLGTVMGEYVDSREPSAQDARRRVSFFDTRLWLDKTWRTGLL